jgi:hypothetical protein
MAGAAICQAFTRWLAARCWSSPHGVWVIAAMPRRPAVVGRGLVKPVYHDDHAEARLQGFLDFTRSWTTNPGNRLEQFSSSSARALVRPASTMTVPDGWILLLPGDAALTRRVCWLP